MTTHKRTLGSTFNQFRASIGTKIVLPYLLLTIAVAGIGAFIVVRLVTSSWQERFHNQLLDAGRIVSESMVNFEIVRLEVLRLVTATDGVPEALGAGDRAALAALVPQIIANSNTDAVELIDQQGQEIYGWQRPPNQIGMVGEERSGANYGGIIDVKRVLDGFVDDFGPKRVFVSQTPYGYMLFTVGPIYQNDQIVGAAMVGTYIDEMVTTLTETALARVTLYDLRGNVVQTSFGGGQLGMDEILQEPPSQYQTVLTLLHESPEQYSVVMTAANSEVPLRRVEVLGQEYSLAYGDWRVRDQSLGYYSVALPTNFIVETAATSRNALGILFAIATVAVFGLGFVIARRIINPLQRLVQTSVAVTEGDLTRRTGLKGRDEIGSLAQSFDTMTERLVERNRLLLEEATKLEAILDSTADGILVLDQQGVVLSSNPAAQQILADASSNFMTNILQELPSVSAYTIDTESEDGVQPLDLARFQQPQRYTAGDKVLSALMAPMKTPDGEVLGTVIALRDITREAEADHLKDSFITNISHELRTPLTAIIGNSQLLELTGQDSLNERHMRYVQTISQNADKLLRHINEVIEISLLQSGNLRLNRTVVNFSEMVSDGVKEWRTRLEDKGLSLQLILPEQNLMVDADPERLSWAINNLLDNAYKYTLSGGVSVLLSQAGDEARLDITDTGVGISVEDQSYLFTRFFRATPHKALYEVAGVGLGLFITRSLVEAHNGQVWAKSELEVGSTFSMTLPLLKPEAEQSLALD